MEVLELAGPCVPAASRAVEVLEAGGLVLLPRHSFELTGAERALLDPAVLARRSKNVSLEPATGRLGGASLSGDFAVPLIDMLVRFSDWAEALLTTVAPRYAPALQRRRTSFRPGPVDQRVLSPRKDDRRLHVDAFPSSPVQGRRILRVFANVDPAGRERVWNVGDDSFEDFARWVGPRTPPLHELRAWTMHRLGLTRGRQTAYDTAMLRLHDRAKLDDAWQVSAPAKKVAFPAGSSWIVATDAVLHAALSGQHALEQTWLMPVEAMAKPDLSPLRILERLEGRALA